MTLNARNNTLAHGPGRLAVAIEREPNAAVLLAENARLKAELAGAELLQSLSGQLIRDQEIESLYEQILEGAKTLMHADFASMQTWCPERGASGSLRLIGSRGFSPQAAQAWCWVSGDSLTSCGAALRATKRVVIPDIDHCEFMAGTETLAAYRTEGIFAAQSTPLFSRTGEFLGMISTHWRAPHEPADHELRLLDILARQAADLIERKSAEATLRRRESWLNGQKEAFQAAVNDAPLEASLGILVRTAIEHSEHKARCAFYLANDERTKLHHVVGMCEAYARQVDGFQIGPDSVACGLAAYSREPVITSDVNDDPRWKTWLWMAEKFGYRACWSFPVETAAGKVVGTFAMYYAEPREITPSDRGLFAVLTRAAGIIVSRHEQAKERARSAAALHANEVQLRAASRQKDEFLAMLAHELRNPLAPIASASAALSQMFAEDGRAQKALSIVKRQTAHLTQLVDDLLDVSRITQGRVQLQCRPTDLTAVVTQALEMIEPQLRAKEHRVSITSTYEPLYVSGDFARLVQCVGNLLSNATKYTDLRGQIQVHTRTEADRAVIEVTDTGAGITSELLPFVFDLFVQSDRTLDRAQGGLGIGLCVVKRLVEMHQGEVAVRSPGVGHGATFEIRLPRIAKPQIPGALSTPIEASRRRVLVVDDNTDAADSLALLLDMHGHETRVAYNGRDALTASESFQPEVALLDLGLPEMDGFELARQLRSRAALAGTRLIALTGYGQAEDRERTRAAGFDDHLVKPVDLPALERSLGVASAPNYPT